MTNDMVAFRYSCMCVCMGTGLRRSSERCNDGPSVATLFIGFSFSFFFFLQWVPILPVDGIKGEGRVHAFFLGGRFQHSPGYHYRSAVLIIYDM